MEEYLYKAIYEHQKGHWFFDSKINFFKILLGENLKGKKGLKVVDLGCGTGALLEYLSGYGRVVGIELSTIALSYAKKAAKGVNVDFMMSMGDRLALKDDSVDLICLSDVLSQETVDVKKVLDECYRVLKKDGFILISDPAIGFLKGEHDSAAHVNHRFARKEVCDNLTRSNFYVSSISYAFVFLFPVVLLMRLIKKISHNDNQKPRADFHGTPKLLNSAVKTIFAIEGFFLRFINMPLGVSIMAVGIKK